VITIFLWCLEGGDIEGLSIPNPSLDDMSFEQLVSEAKKKIQAYSNGWTDYNESDPGITFLELFAWLADMQMYSLNRISVSEKSHLRFLKLLGITPRPAILSRVDITLNPDVNAPAFLIRRRTKFEADMLTDNNTDVPFEIFDHDLCLTSFSIKKILSHSNFQALEVKEAYKIDGDYFYAFGENPRIGNAFYLGLDGLDPDNAVKCYCTSGNNDPESAKIPAKLSMSIYLYEEDLPPPGEHGSEEKPNVHTSARVKWEYATKDQNGNLCWLGIEKSKHHLHDNTQELTHSGKILFSVPFKTSDRREIVLSLPEDGNKNSNFGDDNDSNNLFWIRCVLLEGNYEIAPRIDAILPNTVSAIYGTTVEESLANISNNTIGSSTGKTDYKSNGLPNQVFKVGADVVTKSAHTPIIELLLLYTVHTLDAQDIFCTKWQEVNDFDASSALDNHFVANKLEGKISFGNGVRGNIPEKADKVVMKYRYGMDSHVLVKPGTIFKIADTYQNNLLGLSGTNPSASSPGIDQEKTKDAQARARKDLKIPFIAASSTDYEYIAKQTPGLRVARAKAIASSKPGSNTVNLVVVPFSLSKTPPAPGNGFLHTVAEHIDAHRLITTKVLVSGPNFIGISVTTDLTIKPGTDPRVVKEEVVNALTDFLTPISWPFGRAVYMSEMYAQIDAVDGVDTIKSLSLAASTRNHGTIHDKDGNIIITETSLVYLDTYIITTQ
jgi:predicted phage baseplate assembly protein